MPPYYIIILGEFGIAILLTILTKRASQGTWITPLVAGAAGGLGIFNCYVLAYSLTDSLVPP